MQHRAVQKVKVRRNDEYFASGKNVAKVHVGDETDEYGETGYNVEGKQGTTNEERSTDATQFLSVYIEASIRITFFLGKDLEIILANFVDNTGE